MYQTHLDVCKEGGKVLPRDRSDIRPQRVCTTNREIHELLGHVGDEEILVTPVLA